MPNYSKYSYSQLEKIKATRMDALLRSYHPNTTDFSETKKALSDYKEVLDEINLRELRVEEITKEIEDK